MIRSSRIHVTDQLRHIITAHTIIYVITRVRSTSLDPI